MEDPAVLVYVLSDCSTLDILVNSRQVIVKYHHLFSQIQRYQYVFKPTGIDDLQY